MKGPGRYHTTPEGAEEILHCADMNEKDQEYLKKKAEEAVMCRIAELDERIDVVTKGWTTRRMGKVELTDLSSCVV